jgi:hypothetical protein
MSSRECVAGECVRHLDGWPHVWQIVVTVALLVLVWRVTRAN